MNALHGRGTGLDRTDRRTKVHLLAGRQADIHYAEIKYQAFDTIPFDTHTPRLLFTIYPPPHRCHNC